MKKTGPLAASVAAASATALSASPSSKSRTQPSYEETYNSKKEQQERTAGSDKFAPRFDGLRFIETLVTAHR